VSCHPLLLSSSAILFVVEIDKDSKSAHCSPHDALSVRRSIDLGFAALGVCLAASSSIVNSMLGISNLSHDQY
jgi:hypothetical protein